MKYDVVLRTLDSFADSAVDAFSLYTGFFSDITHVLPCSDCFLAFYDLSGKFKSFFTNDELGLFEMIACLPFSGRMVSVVDCDVVSTFLSDDQVVKYCTSCFRQLADSLGSILDRYNSHVSGDVKLHLRNTIFNIRDRFCNGGSYYNNVIKGCKINAFSKSFKKYCDKALK